MTSRYQKEDDPADVFLGKCTAPPHGSNGPPSRLTIQNQGQGQRDLP